MPPILKKGTLFFLREIDVYGVERGGLERRGESRWELYSKSVIYRNCSIGRGMLDLILPSLCLLSSVGPDAS